MGRVEQALVLEIHDNGPLHELPVAVEGRDVTVRAGKGFQPLIVWDLPATFAQRKRLKQEEAPLPKLTAAESESSDAPSISTS